MPAELSEIIGAISLIEEARSSYPYQRGANGEFDPAIIDLPTWVWDALEKGACHWLEFSAPDAATLVDEFDEGDGRFENGGIDQHAQAFCLIANFAGSFEYRKNGGEYVPSSLPIPTEVWHEIVMLSHEQSAEWVKLEKYRPSWINPDGSFKPRSPKPDSM